MNKILITGGSGFLGAPLVKRLLKDSASIRVVARNEGNLIKLKQSFPEIEIQTGDINDPFVARKAVKDINAVYHLAAFKHVGLAEVDTAQCVKSNIVGTLNLLEHFKGDLFVAISTDKACKVAGVYGASKLLMERLIAEYARLNEDVKYIVPRYGNVLYSTGSVLTKWKKALEEGDDITVTSLEATRFFWTVDQAIDLIYEAIEKAKSGVPYCPEMKSMSIGYLLEAMQQKYGRANSMNVIGMQEGENLHEQLIEGGKTSEEVDKYTIEEIKELI